jgi:uncharacterized damage-inducible protein DinB
MERTVSRQKPQILRYAQDDSRGGYLARDDIRRQLGETFLLNDRVNQLLLEHLDAKVWRAKPPGLGPGGNVRTIAAIFTHMHNVRRKWLRLSKGIGESKGKGERGKGKVRADQSFASSFELPVELDRTRCTQKQVAAALKESAQLCAEMLADKRVTQFVRDGWAKPWGLDQALRAKGETQVLRYPTPRTKTNLWGPRSAQDDNERIKAKTKVEAGRGMSPGAAAMLAYMVSHEAHHRGQVCMLAHQMGYRLPMKVMSKMWAWEGLAVQAHALRAKTKRD